MPLPPMHLPSACPGISLHFPISPATPTNLTSPASPTAPPDKLSALSQQAPSSQMSLDRESIKDNHSHLCKGAVQRVSELLNPGSHFAESRFNDICPLLGRK